MKRINLLIQLYDLNVESIKHAILYRIYKKRADICIRLYEFVKKFENRKSRIVVPVLIFRFILIMSIIKIIAIAIGHPLSNIAFYIIAAILTLGLLISGLETYENIRNKTRNYITYNHYYYKHENAGYVCDMKIARIKSSLAPGGCDYVKKEMNEFKKNPLYVLKI